MEKSNLNDNSNIDKKTLLVIDPGKDVQEDAVMSNEETNTVYCQTVVSGGLSSQIN